jgi:hypothetical protein
MAPGKHLLLALPALLAAMGTTQRAAYAGDGLGVLENPAAPVGSVSVEPAIDPLGWKDGLPEGHALADAASQPVLAEEPASTVADILAQFGGDSSHPAGAATPPPENATQAEPAPAPWAASGGPARTAAGDGGATEASEAPHRSVADILAEARGNIHFLARNDAPQEEDIAIPRLPAEPLARAALLPPADSQAEDAPAPPAAEAPRRSLFDLLADARGIPEASAPAAAPERIHAQQPAPPALAVAAPEPERAALPEGVPRPATDTPRRKIFDILAEARGGGVLPQTEAYLAARAAPEPAAIPAAGAGLPPANPARAPDAPTPAPAPDAQPTPPTGGPAAAPQQARPNSVPPPVATRPEPAVAPALASAASDAPAPSSPIARGEQADRSPATPSAPREEGTLPAKQRPALVAAAAIDPAKLDKLRGGFEAPGGLRMSFGIERAVIVNVVLQSSTQLRVNDLGRTVAGGASAGDVLPAPATVAVVQNGVNSSVHTTLPAATMATVVQNSLDNQHLQTLTRINATVNSAEMMRGVRMQQSLQDSLNRAALTR